jgi:hypothetical protein
LQKKSTQKETEVLRYDLCTACLKRCEYDVKLVVFFPQEVERGLHKMFPFKVVTINGWHIHFFEGACPYFRDELCKLYGTEHMPLDCQIYPVTPTSHKTFFLDENCALSEKFHSDKHYVERCLRKVQDVPEDFLSIYNDL